MSKVEEGKKELVLVVYGVFLGNFQIVIGKECLAESIN